MKSYLITVTATVILAAVSDILIPKNMQKYVSLLTGALILVAVISPLTGLKGISLPSFSLPDSDINQYELEAPLVSEFKSNVEKDIEERLKTEFGTDTRAEITVNTYDGKISGVGKILLFCSYDERIKDRLRLIYGCDSIEFYDGG